MKTITVQGRTFKLPFEVPDNTRIDVVIDPFAPVDIFLPNGMEGIYFIEYAVYFRQLPNLDPPAYQATITRPKKVGIEPPQTIRSLARFRLAEILWRELQAELNVDWKLILVDELPKAGHRQQKEADSEYWIHWEVTTQSGGVVVEREYRSLSKKPYDFQSEGQDMWRVYLQRELWEDIENEE